MTTISVSTAIRDQFVTYVKLAASSKLLVELTNDDHQPASTTIDDDRLTHAVTLIMGRFQQISGFQAKSSDPSHVDAITEGTLAALQSWKDGESERARERSIRFQTLCRNLRNIFTAEAHTTSQLTPKDEVSSGETKTPDMDRANFRRYLPSPGRARSPYNSDREC